MQQQRVQESRTKRERGNQDRCEEQTRCSNWGTCIDIYVSQHLYVMTKGEAMSSDHRKYILVPLCVLIIGSTYFTVLRRFPGKSHQYNVYS
jgi:hypothetical protein